MNNVYRPASVDGAPFVVRRFDANGNLASEIPFLYRHIAQELVDKHKSNGHNAVLVVN